MQGGPRGMISYLGKHAIWLVLGTRDGYRGGRLISIALEFKSRDLISATRGRVFVKCRLCVVLGGCSQNYEDLSDLLPSSHLWLISKKMACGLARGSSGTLLRVKLYVCTAFFT